MTNLIQHAEHGNVSPSGAGSKSRASRKHHHRHLLDHAGRAHVKVGDRGNGRLQLLVDACPFESLAHAGDAGFLLTLDCHVVAIGYPVRLLPSAPRLVRNVLRSGPHGRKGIVMLDVRQRPVEIVSDIVPIVTIEQHDLLSSSGPVDNDSAPLRCPKAIRWFSPDEYPTEV